MFRYLLTPSGFRVPYSASDLAEYIDSEEDDVTRILGLLKELDLVRAVSLPLAAATDVRYEIASELLARGILRVRQEWYAEPSDVIESARSSFEYAVIRVDSLNATCTFDEWGNGVLEREWVGIRLGQAVTDLRLPYKFRGADITEAPEIASLSQLGHRIRFDRAKSEPNVAIGEIVIEGTVAAQVSLPGLVIRQTFQRGFETTRTGAEKRYRGQLWQGEYAGTSAPFKVETIRVSVRFPASHHRLTPPPEAVAFIGSTEKVFGRETARLRRKVQLENGVATLEVENPAPNVFYAICWQPPERP